MLFAHVACVCFCGVLLRQVLDSVRPYLISDGGNIEVVSIDMSTRAVRPTTRALSSQ